MNAEHFTDERIDEICSGHSPLTDEERAFLIEDTPKLEECSHTQDELAAMSDADLMRTAYRAWEDYVRCMYSM